MKAFRGLESMKEVYLARLRRHRAAGELTQGVGWRAKAQSADSSGYVSGCGCAVGCTLQRYDHEVYETTLEIPVVLACVEDTLYEKLPRDRAVEFAEQFLQAVPVGADLSLVWPRLAGELLRWSDAAGDLPSRQVLAVYDDWVAGGIRPDARRWLELSTNCSVIESRVANAMVRVETSISVALKLVRLDIVFNVMSAGDPSVYLRSCETLLTLLSSARTSNASERTRR